jgi:hypothetical protein
MTRRRIAAVVIEDDGNRDHEKRLEALPEYHAAHGAGPGDHIPATDKYRKKTDAIEQPDAFSLPEGKFGGYTDGGDAGPNLSAPSH